MNMAFNFVRISEAKLKELQQKPSLLTTFETDNPDASSLNIDKSWDVLHYLLSTIDDSTDGYLLTMAVLGGEVLDADIELGYGPPIFLPSSEVKEVSQALQQLSLAQVQQHFDPVKIMEAKLYLYDENTKASLIENKEDELSYYMPYIQQIVTFFTVASNNNEAIVKYMN